MTPADWIPIEWPAQWGPGQLSCARHALQCAGVQGRAAPRARRGSARRRSPGTGRRLARVTDVDWAQSADVLAIGDGFWPAYSWKGVADGTAGPTGEPWLDANGWLYLYARSRGGGRAVWVRSDPPKDPRTVRQAHLHLLLAEAFAYGGRRPLWLPPEFATALAGGQSRAMDDWKSLAARARWQEAHSAWRAWPAVAPLIVLSDFSGDNEYVAGETMLLRPASRRRSGRCMLRPRRKPTSKIAARRCIWTRPPPLQTLGPAPILCPQRRTGAYRPGRRARLRRLAAVNQHPHPRFDIYALGDGRVAVARAAFDDPWTLANDAHLMTSKRYDPARLFNGGLLHTHTTSSPDGTGSLVHIINYGGESPGHEVVLQVNRPVKSARFHAPGSASPAAAKLTGNPARPEIVLPDVSGIYWRRIGTPHA